MANILIVDDDPYIRELVSELLKGEGFFIFEAKNGKVALSVLGESKIDLCVLDIMMPAMDGFEFCEYSRKYYKEMPILMLTAKGEISQKVKGFELGADDYLTKPFEGIELIMRVKVLLRRYNVSSAQIVQIGKLILDRNSYTINDKDVILDIPMKEFELLFKLGGIPNKTFTRYQLIEDIWGYDFDGNERTLDVHISRLRDRYPQEEYGFAIKTIRGLGYRLEIL